MWPPLQLQLSSPVQTIPPPTLPCQRQSSMTQPHQRQIQGNNARQSQLRTLRQQPQPVTVGLERRPRRSSTAPQRPLAQPHSAPPTQTVPPPNILSQSLATASSPVHTYSCVNASNTKDLFSYVMVNTDDVPKKLESMVDIFYLFDSIRYIVGYCLPLKCYVEHFGNALACRVIKAIENIELYQEHIHRFKFQIAPLNVVPVNEADFYEMIGSTQAEIENNYAISRNRFYMRPFILRPPSEVMRSVDSSATQSVVNKFQLNTNPHLIPIRLPDGLECYIRLDLAKHCQEDYCSAEVEFGYYHFREVQRDANMKLPPSASTVSSQGSQPQQHHHHYQQPIQNIQLQNNQQQLGSNQSHYQRHGQYNVTRHNHHQSQQQRHNQASLAMLTSVPSQSTTMSNGGGGAMKFMTLPPMHLPPRNIARKM